MFLGLSSKKSGSKPPTESQSAKFGEQKHSRDQWRDDAERIRGILTKLGQTYSAHKGDFALGRYEELKGMIKESLAEFEAALNDNKTKHHGGRYEDIAKQYSAKTPASRATRSAPTGGKTSGVVSNLKHTAAAMASHEGCNDEGGKSRRYRSQSPM